VIAPAEPAGVPDLTPVLAPLACPADGCTSREFVSTQVARLRPVVGKPGSVKVELGVAWKCYLCGEPFDAEAGDKAARRFAPHL
jgi:hypothetical protein